MKNSLKAVDTHTLIELSERAAEKFSRSIDPAAYDKLDENGWHIIDQLPVWQPFVRCIVLMKMADADTPESVTLDISHKDFGLLPDATEVAALMDSLRECSECGRTAPHKEDDYMCITCRSKA